MHPLVEQQGSSSMTEFGRYEECYLRVARQINRNISEGIPGNDAEMESELTEAEQYIKGMEVECRAMKGEPKKRCLGKTQQYRADFGSTRNAWAAATERRKLGLPPLGAVSGAPGGGGTSGGVGGFGRGHGRRLAAAEDSLGRTGALLEDSRRVVGETEAVGVGVLDDLESQRRSLLRSHENVKRTMGVVERARVGLQSIERSVLRRRVVLYAIIVVLLGLIGLLLYVRIRMHRH